MRPELTNLSDPYCETINEYRTKWRPIYKMVYKLKWTKLTFFFIVTVIYTQFRTLVILKNILASRP